MIKITIIFCLIIIVILSFVTEKITEDYRKTSIISFNIIFDLLKIYKKTKEIKYLVLFCLDIFFLIFLFCLFIYH
jgi:hypothetical protein